MQIIGLVGLIGSGKDTVAQRLVNNHGYVQFSWASVLKDVTAILFGWDRSMLEGTTAESRADREKIDVWWSEQLGKPWSPRIAMQQVGTEILRNNLHKDIWILAIMKRLQGFDKVVISDTRFLNEISAVRKMNGTVWNIKRGQDPNWFLDLLVWKDDFKNINSNMPNEKEIEHFMTTRYPTIHASEYSWNGSKFDNVIFNNGTLDELNESVDRAVNNLVLN